MKRNYTIIPLSLLLLIAMVACSNKSKGNTDSEGKQPNSTVVGAENGCVTVFLVRVGICPWAAVPMREQHDAFLRFELVAADDVAGF